LPLPEDFPAGAPPFGLLLAARLTAGVDAALPFLGFSAASILGCVLFLPAIVIGIIAHAFFVSDC
jgi:hypothetical protein